MLFGSKVRYSSAKSSEKLPPRFRNHSFCNFASLKPKKLKIAFWVLITRRLFLKSCWALYFYMNFDARCGTANELLSSSSLTLNCSIFDIFAQFYPKFSLHKPCSGWTKDSKVTTEQFLDMMLATAFGERALRQGLKGLSRPAKKDSPWGESAVNFARLQCVWRQAFP